MKAKRRAYPNLKAYLEAIARDGVTQAEVAARLGISESHLSEIKNGREQPSLRIAMQLAEECGVPVESFLMIDSSGS